MAKSKPFETAVETVNSKIATTKHLHLKTKKIIEEDNLKTALANIQKKNFTLTSANHLAAILIKIIEIYVDKRKNKDVTTFINYINLLEKGNLDLFTVRKILKALGLNKLTELIEKKYGSISDEAETILRSVNLNGIGLDKEVMKQFDTTNKQIDAAKGGLLTSLEFKRLLDVFEKIKSVCKQSFNYNELLTIELNRSLPEVFRLNPTTISKTKLPTLQENLFNEFAYLYYVIHQEYDQANTILKECHKDAVRKLLTARRRIEQAYKRITGNNATTAKKTRQRSSSLSSEPKTPNDLPNNQLPPMPESPPPPVPTDDISDDPPPLGPVTQNNTPTATTEQKTPSTLPRPGRPAPKSSDFYNQREKLKTANGEHTPPADPPPPAPKGKSGTAKTPRQQYKRDLETQRKKGLPTTPPKLEVPTGGPPQ